MLYFCQLLFLLLQLEHQHLIGVPEVSSLSFHTTRNQLRYCPQLILRCSQIPAKETCRISIRVYSYKKMTQCL